MNKKTFWSFTRNSKSLSFIGSFIWNMEREPNLARKVTKEPNVFHEKKWQANTFFATIRWTKKKVNHFRFKIQTLKACPFQR